MRKEKALLFPVNLDPGQIDAEVYCEHIKEEAWSREEEEVREALAASTLEEARRKVEEEQVREAEAASREEQELRAAEEASLAEEAARLQQEELLWLQVLVTALVRAFKNSRLLYSVFQCSVLQCSVVK